jgi:hypothetical protein
MNGVFMFLFCGFWSVMVLCIDTKVAQELWRQFESSYYPVTMGEVTYSQVTTQHTSKGGTIYGVDIKYHYVVNDHPFDGSRFRYMSGFNNSSDYESVRSTVNSNPVKSQIRVYFNPSNPQDAVLSPDLTGGDFMAPLFLMPFNLVMFGFWIGIGGWLRERIFKPLAGGVKIIVEGSRTRIRLPQFGALVWPMIAMGALSFVSIFVVGFASRFQPSMLTAFLTLFFVIGTGVGIYIRQWRKIHSGDDDLILDETSTTIALPETYGRKQRVTVNRSEIVKLTVEQVEHRGSKGGVSYTYAPTLWLRRDENVRTQKLADWGDRKKAEAFAEWLRGRLNLAEVPVERP